jgi:hypothetical protein
MNAMLVKMIFTMWRSLGHTKTYIFTNGMDHTTPEGLETSGLGEWKGYIEANPYVRLYPLTSYDSPPRIPH